MEIIDPDLAPNQNRVVHRRANVTESRRAPTLLLFTLGAKRESARRRILPQRLNRHEIALREGLAQHVSSIAAEADCELVISSPDRPPFDARWLPQSGNGFGERLASSIDAVDIDDQRPLIVVGSDTPGMSERHVNVALSQLAADPNAVVLGPSLDGGMYLIGMARPLGSLSGVRWCSRHALDDFIAALRIAGRTIVLLDPLEDIDTKSDLERWLAKRAGSISLLCISSLLRSLLRELKQSATSAPLHSAVATRLSAAIRPPPTAA